jgi:hypothetical protein
MADESFSSPEGQLSLGSSAVAQCDRRKSQTAVPVAVAAAQAAKPEAYLLSHKMAGTVTANRSVEIRSMEADSASAAL